MNFHSDRFGYALLNGTVGVYNIKSTSNGWCSRAWRVQSKHSVKSLQVN